jgi:hypothetical protein
MKNLEQIFAEDPSIKDKRTEIISTGIDMKCNKVMTTGVLYMSEGQWCLRTEGIDMICHKISDLYLDTKENRKELRNSLK